MVGIGDRDGRTVQESGVVSNDDESVRVSGACRVLLLGKSASVSKLHSKLADERDPPFFNLVNSN
jgi:hypothetical protein